ncbi:unnamed protein product [Pseudo-nitzschia multistriata]|uniref:Uncharacterized protein n=1 Tax=Pseudo-nitzschia multistriata TaxID=183589 RepID=A0A448ZR76_9STRA|nr:unnamed protein product [Pseudo-nitzschia multistriata]
MVQSQLTFRNALGLAAVVLQAILGGGRISGSYAWATTSPSLRSVRSSSSSSSSLQAESTVAPSATGVPFSAIVGNGRIGGALSDAGNCVVLGRGDSIDANGEGPILLATRNDALDGIVESCPPNRRKDLVFLQNGYLDDFLESKGLSDNTQVLLYLSVSAKGVAPTDGVTAFNPEGLTASTGEWADAFAGRLAALDLKCNVVSGKDYRPAMFEKLMWISTYMLVGAANDCPTVGDAGRDHSSTVEAIVAELVEAVSASEGISFPPGTMDRLSSYTDVVADFPCGVKEFEWRNKYFWDLGDEAVPTHNGLLRECAAKGILSFELPE